MQIIFLGSNKIVSEQRLLTTKEEQSINTLAW